MRAFKATDIKGNWATLLSVWNTDDSLDLGRIATEIDFLIAAKVDGIYSNGTAGEFHAQLEDEFDQISELLAQKCNAAGMPFQIGVSHMSAQISRDRLKRTVHLAPAAVQIILPDWFPTTEAENINFLTTMAETACGIGLVLYNPPHAKLNLRPKEIGRLVKEVPSLIGLKTPGGDEQWYAEMRAHLSGISVFVPGHHLASGVKQGAQGAYSNVACLNPAAAQKWTDLINTDLSQALEIESRLQQFIAKHIAPYITEHGYCNAACDRLMALIGGWADVGGSLRWPYRSIDPSEAARLRPIVASLIPEFVIEQ